MTATVITQDNYYSFPAVSNSKLTEVKYLKEPEKFAIDKQMAYDNGNLVDCIITEPHRLDLFQRKVSGVDRTFTPEQIEMALQMRKAFYADPLCAQMAKACTFQRISHVERFLIEDMGVSFELPAKCKWDMYSDIARMGGDIKSTFATTEKQFLEACHTFDYFRSRAWYMDLENSKRDVIIGISKKNYKIFKVHIERGDDNYNLGKSQYCELAFQWLCMFGDLSTLKNTKQ